MNILQYLIQLRPAIPTSNENAPNPMSNGELKRVVQQKGVLINGETVDINEEMDFPVFSLVFFPKGARRTTLI